MIADTHKFKINFTAFGQGTTVEMDGKVLDCVRSIVVTTSVDAVTKVVLELVGVEAEVTGEVMDITTLSSEARTYR